MHIDARSLDAKELSVKLKEILASEHGCEVDITIAVSTAADIKKVKPFILMSGCNVAVENQDDYYIMNISGMSCCS